MNKTLRISFSLKNTYRVNSILYSLKQVPLLKKVLPDSLYEVWALKQFANVISLFWEILSVFLGKFLYFILMIFLAMPLYEGASRPGLFLHLLLFLTAVGTILNTSLFNPTRDKYYAIILMRMDAREYTLVNYGYAILKVLVGFLPFCLLFGLNSGVPLWMCLLLPFSVAGAKLVVAAFSLRYYERSGKAYNENKVGKYAWLWVGLLLAAAYGLPVAGLILPETASICLLLLCIPAGVLGARKILRFSQYREVNQELLSQMLHQMDDIGHAAQKQSRRMISADTAITSRRKGFEYLNELFIRRHQKILWKSTKRIAAVCLFLVLGLLLVLFLLPDFRKETNEVLLNFLPYFVFIMYAINRGTSFTQALFMNCDHSLLTYSFFKQPKMILRLFAIRLREIIKVNLLPAAVIGVGLAVLLYASGGTENPLEYGVLIVSILSMSVFFSVHYLTIYYLLQPYNAGTEMKSGTYRLILMATYLVCYFLMQVRMPILLFGLLCIAFCLLYCGVACFLIYRFAPRTFRIRT